MAWLPLAVVAWLTLALLAGLVIGHGVRLADQRERLNAPTSQLPALTAPAAALT